MQGLGLCAGDHLMSHQRFKGFSYLLSYLTSQWAVKSDLSDFVYQ